MKKFIGPFFACFLSRYHTLYHIETKNMGVEGFFSLSDSRYPFPTIVPNDTPIL